jgi:hypothetical protein
LLLLPSDWETTMTAPPRSAENGSCSDRADLVRGPGLVTAPGSRSGRSPRVREIPGGTPAGCRDHAQEEQVPRRSAGLLDSQRSRRLLAVGPRRSSGSLPSSRLSWLPSDSRMTGAQPRVRFRDQGESHNQPHRAAYGDAGQRHEPCGGMTACGGEVHVTNIDSENRTLPGYLRHERDSNARPAA